MVIFEIFDRQILRVYSNISSFSNFVIVLVDVARQCYNIPMNIIIQAVGIIK